MLYLLHHDTKHVLVTHTITSRSRRGQLAYIYIHIHICTCSTAERTVQISDQPRTTKETCIYMCDFQNMCEYVWYTHKYRIIYHSRKYLNAQQTELDNMVLKHAIHKSFNFAQLQNVLLPIVIASQKPRNESHIKRAMLRVYIYMYIYIYTYNLKNQMM